jgi:CheY-like chemotaxis protein
MPATERQVDKLRPNMPGRANDEQLHALKGRAASPNVTENDRRLSSGSPGGSSRWRAAIRGRGSRNLIQVSRCRGLVQPETVSKVLTDRSQGRVRTTVLVAESDAALRALMGWCLFARGYRVILAEDGLEALDRALCNSVDAIVVNAALTLPALDVGTLLAYLPTDPRLRALPVVVVVDGAVPEGLDARFVLEKPFDERRLLDKIEAVIGPSRATPPCGIQAVPESGETTPVVEVIGDQTADPITS